MISRRVALSVSLCASLACGCASSVSPSSTIAPLAMATAVTSPSARASPSLSPLPSEIDIEANDTLWGTLNATLIVDPRTQREPAGRAAVERALADLR